MNPGTAPAGRARRRPLPLRLWTRLRSWRRRRPFTGGLLAILSGAWICALPLAPVTVMIAQGIAGVPSVLMGVFLMALGMIVWAQPRQATIAGVLTVLIGLAALVMSNLGGFVVGSLLAFAGGGLMFAWRPTPRVRRRDRRRAARAADPVGAPAPRSAPAEGGGPAPRPGPRPGEPVDRRPP
ncbi:DUF6114 domain-containing protein [Streptomonospora nanhaiensis]|uniref:DUF6114 domain-containing protein n=1 Tax=Streptomonospora nanhaiensis TaxID=1323731 RepID=UPI001C38F7DE|nr:DUF6114 domain-containing protein [Streptomonospora nanhaiensis]MBV2366713.1 hypothetical protein [Streptomonospora nanhaiensis]